MLKGTQDHSADPARRQSARREDVAGAAGDGRMECGPETAGGQHRPRALGRRPLNNLQFCALHKGAPGMVLDDLVCVRRLQRDHGRMMDRQD